jgi:hypothetical protein
LVNNIHFSQKNPQKLFNEEEAFTVWGIYILSPYFIIGILKAKENVGGAYEKFCVYKNAWVRE